MLEALDGARRVERVLIADGSRGRATEIRERAADAGLRVVYVTRAELDELSFGGNHQGVAAQLAAAPRATVQDLLRRDPARFWPPLLLAADQVQDVGNLGSLVRTLEALGGAGLLLPGRRSAPVSGGLARASVGASLRLPVVEVGNLARALDELRRREVQVVGLDATAPTPMEALKAPAACCLVVGSESEGLRPAVRDACDLLVSIPIRGAIGSLNVAVAGALVLYHVARSRRAESSDGP